MRTWKRKGRGESVRITSQLDSHEAELLASLVSSMCELLTERADTAPRDALSEVTGIRIGHSDAPDDATLGRLLPDFHRPDQDEELSAEVVNGRLNSALRSVNEPKIIDAKLGAAQVLLDTLPDGGGDLSLTVEQATAWLTALNDVRLALGGRCWASPRTPPPTGCRPTIRTLRTSTSITGSP